MQTAMPQDIPISCQISCSIMNLFIYLQAQNLREAWRCVDKASHLHPLKVILPPKASMIFTNFAASRLKQTWIRFRVYFASQIDLFIGINRLCMCASFENLLALTQCRRTKFFITKCLRQHEKTASLRTLRESRGMQREKKMMLIIAQWNHLGEGDGAMEKSLEQKTKRWTSSSVRESLFLKSSTQPQQQVPDDNVPRQQ